jgi:glycosyltransferase involved in cell wall biosynthesis
MAAGLPVVGTQVDGIHEFVQDGYNGLLVPTRNAEALADSMIRILGDGALRKRLSENALQTAKEFSWEKNIHSFTSLFNSLVGL